MDHALTVHGFAPTRSRAADIIRRGLVRVDGRVVTKAGYGVEGANRIEVEGEATRWVSRGAEKLLAALSAFAFDPSGRIALDVGASSGGFTEVLLARGARRVYAIDVGVGQLHPRLAADPRVISLERTDARRIDEVVVPDQVGTVVADVSFIALHKVLPAALARAATGAWLVALIKPQFEVGPAKVGKRGIVREAGARQAAVSQAGDWLAAQPGWSVTGIIPSPITGAAGNEEFLIGATRDG